MEEIEGRRRAIERAILTRKVVVAGERGRKEGRW